MSVDPPDLRPRRTTPVLGLPIPGDADPPDGPAQIGDLGDAIDLLAAAGFLRFAPGDVRWIAGQGQPDGWLICNGQLVSRTVYAALFAAIGTLHGPGDGSTTFAVPNLIGRMALGAGGARPLGTVGGAETVALTAAQSGTNGNAGTLDDSPDHSHYVPPQGTGGDEPGHTHGLAHQFYTNGGAHATWFAGQASGWQMFITAGPATTDRSNHHTHVTSGGQTWGASARHRHTLAARNADEAHQNMSPFVALTALIKA